MEIVREAGGRRGGSLVGEEKERKGKLTHPVSILLSLFSYSSRKECEDLTLSIKPLDKFNHGVPSAKSWLNRNANNGARGLL